VPHGQLILRSQSAALESLFFMHYQHALRSGITIASTRPEHAEALEDLQNIVFPTLEDAQRFKARHYLKHIELFPDGQFVALDGGQVIGMTSAIRLDFDFAHAQHSFADISQGGWLTSHNPQGPWLYGADIGVHPQYRRRGIARALYAARQQVVRRLGLKGQVTVGMMSGYGALKSEMSADAYYQKLVEGEIIDPTLSPQMRLGFRPRALVSGYLHDPVCDNYGALIVLEADTDISFE